MKRSRIQDADLRKVEPALMRAAAQARRIAAETNTPLVLYEKGRVIRQAVVRERSTAYGKSTKRSRQ